MDERRAEDVPTSPDTDPEAQDAPSGLLPDELLQPGERVLLECKPAPAMILVESYRTVLLGVLLVIANEVTRPDRWLFDEARLVVAGIAAGGVLLRLGIALLDWLSRSYVLTDRRIIRQRGILQVNVFECRLDRIQNTYLVFPLAQRLFGMGTIVLATAGTGQPEAAWYCLGRPLEVHQDVVRAISRAREAEAPPDGSGVG